PNPHRVANWTFGDGRIRTLPVSPARPPGNRPRDYAQRFSQGLSRGSVPEGDAGKNLPAGEIRSIFDRVHDRVLLEAPSFTPEQMKEAVEAPYAVEGTKLGSLYFCSHHEMLHAGQIGLIRRLTGKQPIR